MARTNRWYQHTEEDHYPSTPFERQVRRALNAWHNDLFLVAAVELSIAITGQVPTNNLLQAFTPEELAIEIEKGTLELKYTDEAHKQNYPTLAQLELLEREAKVFEILTGKH